MSKNLFIMAVASALVILGLFVVDYILYGFAMSYDVVFNLLGLLFSNNDIGVFIHQSLALLIMPLLVTLVLVLPFWIARKELPGFSVYILWASWLVTVSMLVWR